MPACRVRRTHMLVTAIASLVVAVPAMAQTLPDAYQQLKAIEASFPRIPYAELVVGTFDGRSGKFTGEVSTIEPPDCSTGANGKPHCTKEFPDIPVMISRARNVGLKFNVENVSGPFTVTVNGTTLTSKAGATSLTVPVNQWLAAGSATPIPVRGNVKWTIVANNKRYSDQLYVDRMSFGAGAYIIPVMPVAIIYDPPQDSLHKSLETYIATQSIGTSVTMSFSSSHGSSNDFVPGQFLGISDMVKQFKTGSQIASAAATAVPQLAIVAGVLDKAATVVQALYGTSTATGTNVTTDVNGTTHQLTLQTRTTYKTAGIGPGKGDVFVYLSNVPVAWLAVGGGPLSFTPLGIGREGISTVGELQADLKTIRTMGAKVGPTSKLDSMSIIGLLALDPFVKGGNSAALPPTRFDSLSPPFGVSLVQSTQAFTIAEVMTQRQGSTQMDQTVEKDQAGLLAGTIFNMGPDSTGTFTSSVTQSNLSENTSASSREVDLTLGGPGLDTVTLNGYYDRVFGTIAVRIIPSGPDSVSGDLISSGAPPGERVIASVTPQSMVSRAAPGGLAGRRVTLTIGNRTYETATNDRGHYVFRIQHNAGMVGGTIAVGNSEVKQGVMVMAGVTHVPPLAVKFQ